MTTSNTLTAIPIAATTVSSSNATSNVSPSVVAVLRNRERGIGKKREGEGEYEIRRFWVSHLANKRQETSLYDSVMKLTIRISPTAPAATDTMGLQAMQKKKTKLPLQKCQGKLRAREYDCSSPNSSLCLYVPNRRFPSGLRLIPSEEISIRLHRRPLCTRRPPSPSTPHRRRYGSPRPWSLVVFSVSFS
ncbi:hypothetical protein ACLOJK_040811 [Asimina triloba]